MTAAPEDMLASTAATKSKSGDEDGNNDDDEHTMDTDKLSYEIFSILESKFLFGYDDPKLPLHPPPDPSHFKNHRGKVCILSIDGAGMRGILPGKALSHLERSLQSISGQQNARISDFFDVVAGTGVGGLFASMLFSSSPFSADETWRFLAEKARRFLKKPSSGFLARAFRGGGSGTAAATAAMEKAMKETFGEKMTLRDTVKPVLIPCYDLRSSSPLVFSRADALESESYDFRLWEVCRATWAEPGRFEPADIRSVDGSRSCLGIDGGLAMTNPAAAAITHVLHNKQEFPFVRGVEDLMVLSLGCGAGAAVPDASLLRRWTAKEWARPMARIASDGAADLVDHAVALAFAHARSSNYVRIQANCSSMGACSGVDADSDPSPSNVKVLVDAAEAMLKQKNVESVLFSGKRISERTNLEKLDWFAGELVLEHQRRSCRIAPTVAFKQAVTNPS
ncbi:patatin-like protein 6 [Dioscorea cayenensis subsp. rotundata]|uniref:Patatin n=1 Tax=Dioscorea cayennensis subsp. rotundata TaxID=55577 RepID=A0AB40CG92_DIOCR|nr:patatin-like protein 6 [Dioscorea cayenensis subsp. rotundata]